ncbi:MauE/DoxX family redox-associated membrane protein [Ornithinimicrobium sp. LYQ121]|uniref:MauE/DoxX family redox-associated membrane protein n=1 Tax=Ornithinimicrobium sp. LYQ121 TaxID=3378801 RepID=UPI0038531579
MSAVDTALSLAPLTLAAVLVLSGVSKIRDTRASTLSMMRLLRLPGVVANGSTARALPFLELATAALLLTPWTPTFALGAVLALGLFVAFWAVIVRAMGFDPRPTCGCFGRIGDHRITGRTVVRNTLLLALSVVTAGVALTGRSTGALVGAYTGGDWLWLLLALALAAVTLLVLGSGPGRPGTPAHQPRTAAHQPPAATRPTAGELDYVRAPVPDGLLVGPDHQVTSPARLLRSQAQLVVLVNCWCGPTHEALARLSTWRERLPQLGVQLVFTPYPFDSPEAVGDRTGIWWDPGSRLYAALGAGASPSAVLLGADGLLAGGPVDGIEAIEEFLDDIVVELSDAAEPSTVG